MTKKVSSPNAQMKLSHLNFTFSICLVIFAKKYMTIELNQVGKHPSKRKLHNSSKNNKCAHTKWYAKVNYTFPTYMYTSGTAPSLKR